MNMRKIKAFGPLAWMLLIPALNVVYTALNHAGPQVYSLVSDLDRAIPFLPVFILPYVIWYPFIAGTLLLFFFSDMRMYYRTLATLCLGMLICYVVYAGFQTTIQRPELTGTGWLQGLVGYVYAHDEPYNCFPSIHVLTCYVMIKGLRNSKPVSAVFRYALMVLAWSIIASTVFVKQHALLDAAGAILLVELLFTGFSWVLRGAAEKIPKNGRGAYRSENGRTLRER